jgi:tRNA (cmo5U34)-methyltransferase
MKFNFDNQENFDKHIDLSIPDYGSMIHIVKEVIECFVGQEGTHLDVGCSTGKLVLELYERGIDSTGVDLSKIIQSHPRLKKLDYFAFNGGRKYDVITSIFFLQFLRDANRKSALNKIFKHDLKRGGRVIICEKTHFDDPIIENVMDTSYLKFKRQHFTAEEILEKKFQLAESMFLKTQSQLLEELSEFGDLSVFWKSYGFVGVIVTPKND